MRFKFELVPSWPPLAWISVLRQGSNIIEVTHGTQVEVAEQWACEAVWDAPFEDGNFDLTDIVMGSGIRLRGNTAVFVSSGSTVDRLHLQRIGNDTYVSNSLVCLLATTHSSLDPTYTDYVPDFLSILHGIDKYKRYIPASGGEIEIIYFDNLSWNGTDWSKIAKPNAQRPFGAYADYRAFLDTSLRQLTSNMIDATRRQRYRPLGTLSAGYDSPTVTALMRNHGQDEVLCFDQATSRDDGKALAAYFGVRPVVVDVDAWRKRSLPEVPFMATNGVGEEVHYCEAAPILTNRVLMTGFHGGKVWDKDAPFTSDKLMRGDISGMSLSEYRLWAGFIHCPVPYFGARQMVDIKRISASLELSPWDIGGNYSRPICRRIVEEAGVPRAKFGRLKSYASRWYVMLPEFMTSESIESYLEFLGATRNEWRLKGKRAPMRNLLLDRWRAQAFEAIGHILVSFPGFFRLRLNRFDATRKLTYLSPANHIQDYYPILGMRRHLVAWATEKAKERYAR